MMNEVNEVETPLNVHFNHSSVQLYENEKMIDCGSVYVCENAVLWQSEKFNLAIPYKKVSVHAVCTDPNSFPSNHLLMMLDGFRITENEPMEDDDSDSETTLLRFVIGSDDELREMYNALNECQALNPDSCAESDSEEDEEYENGYVGPYGDTTGQFDDA